MGTVDGDIAICSQVSQNNDESHLHADLRTSTTTAMTMTAMATTTTTVTTTAKTTAAVTTAQYVPFLDCRKHTYGLSEKVAT